MADLHVGLDEWFKAEGDLGNIWRRYLNAKHKGNGSMSRLSSLDEYDRAVKARRIADNTAIRLHTLWREWQQKRDRLAAEADAAWERLQADMRRR